MADPSLLLLTLVLPQILYTLERRIAGFSSFNIVRRIPFIQESTNHW